jgi:quercetin dioxygenase-like cupin family protein
MDDPLSFLGRPLPAAFALREVAIAPGGHLPYDEAEWRDAIVVVERGEIEVRCPAGNRHRFVAGDVLTLAGIPLRTLENPGPEPALLSAVSRRPMSSPPAPGPTCDTFGPRPRGDLDHDR